MLREIGSDFWEIPNTVDSSVFIDRMNYFWWNSERYHRYFFKSGRNAIKAICECLEPLQVHRVLLPAYTCETVIEPFLDEGWEIGYYSINLDISIDIVSLIQKIKTFSPSVILCHDYFGFHTLGNAVKSLRQASQKGVVIIEDLTQSLMTDIYLPFADYYIASLRKFFAMPEGGVLISQKKLNFESIIPPDEQIIPKSEIAFSEKALYMQNGDKNLKKQFRKKYKLLAEYIDQNDQLQGMNRESLSIFYGNDIRSLKERRRTNFQTIYGFLNECQGIQPIFSNLENNTVPLYFPFYVNHPKYARNDLQSYLSKRSIYCPIIWPKPQMLSEIDAKVDFIYDNILCIPIDQRYGNDEMNHISESMIGLLGTKDGLNG